VRADANSVCSVHSHFLYLNVYVSLQHLAVVSVATRSVSAASLLLHASRHRPPSWPWGLGAPVGPGGLPSGRPEAAPREGVLEVGPKRPLGEGGLSGPSRWPWRLP
jgi:hypothetical protein